MDDDEAHGRRRTTVRWLVSLCEPLLSTEQRQAADADFAAVLAATPRWGSAWFAGLIADTLATLPSEDPWRHLGGRVETAAGGVHTPDGDPVGPPPVTGAQSVAGSFGTVADSVDLAVGDHHDPPANPDIAARADLPAEAAAVVAISRMGFGPTRDALDLLFDQADDGPQMLALAGAALRAVTHRRRAYEGAGDLFTWVYGIQTLIRADRIATGLDEDDKAAARRADEWERGRIADGHYTEFRYGL